MGVKQLWQDKHKVSDENVGYVNIPTVIQTSECIVILVKFRCPALSCQIRNPLSETVYMGYIMLLRVRHLTCLWVRSKGQFKLCY